MPQLWIISNEILSCVETDVTLTIFLILPATSWHQLVPQAATWLSNPYSGPGGNIAYCSSSSYCVLLFTLIETCKSLLFHQCSETNVMHFLFNLLKIKGLYMFRALLAYPQEALHMLYLVYCMRVWSGTKSSSHFTPGAANWHNHTQYTKCSICSASWGWASNAWNM
jgi:hypothetical protein